MMGFDLNTDFNDKRILIAGAMLAGWVFSIAAVFVSDDLASTILGVIAGLEYFVAMKTVSNIGKP